LDSPRRLLPSASALGELPNLPVTHPAAVKMAQVVLKDFAWRVGQQALLRPGTPNALNLPEHSHIPFL
jgi:hypothetical protein